MNTDPLVGLKDTLLEKVNTCDATELRNVLTILNAVFPQWVAADYHYKGKEVAIRVLDTAVELKDELAERHPRRKKLPQVLDTLIADATKLANEFWGAECAWRQG